MRCMQGASSQSQTPGDATVTARIYASRSALQLKRSLLAVKEHKLLDMLAQHQATEQPAAASSASSADRIVTDAAHAMACAAAMAARKCNLQVCIQPDQSKSLV